MINLSESTFNIVLYSWIGFAVILFPVLLKVTAPYGRHTKSNWGPLIDNRLGWILMELPSLIVFSWFMLRGSNTMNVVSAIIFILWVSHYTYRAIVFPMRLKTGKKKMPVVIMLFAVIFNCMNGFVNGYWFGSLSPAYHLQWLSDPRFLAGIILFIAGFATHQYHDQILIMLRKESTTGYKIPHGGLFRYISCPNFFGEIIEWGGFALLTWCMPAFSFFLWTFVNLVPRALDHHQWYKQKFADYPKDRKAVVPGVL